MNRIGRGGGNQSWISCLSVFVSGADAANRSTTGVSKALEELRSPIIAVVRLRRRDSRLSRPPAEITGDLRPPLAGISSSSIHCYAPCSSGPARVARAEDRPDRPMAASCPIRQSCSLCRRRRRPLPGTGRSPRPRHGRCRRLRETPPRLAPRPNRERQPANG